MERELFTLDHEAFRSIAKRFATREVAANVDQWDLDGNTGLDVWHAAGSQGLLGIGTPEEFGGGGEPDFRYRTILFEELASVFAGSLMSSFSVQDDIVAPYLIDLGTDEQKRRLLPGMAAGELIGAIAMTEPGAGSDLQRIRTSAVRDGSDWVLNGQKTFITNGVNCDFVIVVVRTADAGSNSFSLIIVDDETPGFSRGRKLSKIGQAAQDTAEMSFVNVRVPAENLLGEEHNAFAHLMERLPRERMSIAAVAQTTSDAVFAETTRYVFGREAFGQRIGDFQNTRFVLAEIATELDVTRSYFDHCVRALNAGTLSPVDAAKVKWWSTEMQQRIVTRCLQLHGGYGYIREYPVARAFVDARIQTIYGGTTEIMKEIIGRDIAGGAS